MLYANSCLINFLFSFFLFLPSFSLLFFTMLQCLVSCYHVIFFFSFKKNKNSKMKEGKKNWYFLLILFCILLKFKFYHPTKRHTFSFWPCYIRYVMFDYCNISVEFSLLMALIHLSLETTYRFIYLRYFFTVLLPLSLLSLILGSLQISLCFVFRYYLKLL